LEPIIVGPYVSLDIKDGENIKNYIMPRIWQHAYYNYCVSNETAL